MITPSQINAAFLVFSFGHTNVFVPYVYTQPLTMRVLLTEYQWKKYTVASWEISESCESPIKWDTLIETRPINTLNANTMVRWCKNHYLKISVGEIKVCGQQICNFLQRSFLTLMQVSFNHVLPNKTKDRHNQLSIKVDITQKKWNMFLIIWTVPG